MSTDKAHPKAAAAHHEKDDAEANLAHEAAPAKAQAGASAPRYFRVMHAGVGPFRKDQVVNGEGFGPGVDYDRLLGLGAVVEVAEAEFKAANPAAE